MNFCDLYLRGSSQAAVEQALLAAGLLIQDGDQLMPAAGVTVDVIGLLPEKTEWHVNVWTTADITFDQRQCLKSVLIETPKTPHRMRA